MTPAGESGARPQDEPGAPQTEAPPPTNDRLRLVVLAALTAGLIGLCVLLAVPFLPAITWGVALAILAWPLHRWVSRHVERPGIAAGLSTLVVVIGILVPGVFVSYQLAQEAAAAADKAQNETAAGAWREKVAGIPVVGRVVEWADRVGVDVEAEAYRLIGSYTRDAASLAQGSVTAAIQFLAAVFILYYAFRDRSVLMHGVRDLLPLSRGESDRVFDGAADSVHANLYATFVTSVIDATGGGLMFWLLGLPSPVLWGVVIFVLSFLPVLGAGMVWFPAAVFLAMTGRWLAAAALIAWGILSFMIVDNVIYVRLAGERMRMHDVPALIAFVGGIAIFGVSGMILGPAILAVTMAVLEVWKRRMAGGRDATQKA
jgi:predicted PurR-regulated permease PerM